MRSTVRLVLSSYVVVIAGCSTATVGQPAPAGAPGAVMQQGSASRAFAAPIRFARARATLGDTLSVRIQGPAVVKAAGPAEFTAAVEHGRAQRYYYWWFVAACAKGAGCVPSSYRLAAEGEDRTSLAVPFAAANAEKDIVVQVAEIDGDGQTGSSAQFAVTGPAPRNGGKERVSGGICDWFAGEFYPHKGLYTDPISGRTWERGFRRDYCRNAISWRPES